ncbi:8-oxo-dGTP diphosphatase [Actinopolyspora lacussalsi subsp. righensis]|uniref:8-oxo-dGTP diphosphatase n=2 Tax=Actinopolyspora righensis TaxID=995060 RepID=A0A1I7C725_9ACTN|nr:NUDIX hydrolase [Actinopolyspora righensis]SFT95251.1 8-oxo-dGTP diphosphatase [Actinopolyspora righensis]
MSDTEPASEIDSPATSKSATIHGDPAGQRPTVMAAGAVLWRPGSTEDTEIAVVHRPRYGDWSLPKGKLDPGETIPQAAAREVTEETGVNCVLSRHLRRICYEVPHGRDGRASKSVDYFAARALPGEFVANEEVDELRWVPAARAHEWLTYADDHHVVDSFLSLPTTMSTVLLVRHAEAGKRTEFHGDDNLRPLSEAGWRQRNQLHSLLSLFGPERVHSAPRLRCEQTVDSVAGSLRTNIESEPALSEEAYRADPEAGRRRLLRIAAEPGTAVVCSQGGVIPDLVGSLARSDGLPLGEVNSRKASVWVLSFLTTTHSGDGHSDDGSRPAPLLAAADYFPAPTPENA